MINSCYTSKQGLYNLLNLNRTKISILEVSWVKDLLGEGPCGPVHVLEDGPC